MQITSFSATKTWSLSLNVADQAVVPVVTAGHRVLSSEGLLTNLADEAAGWPITSANWMRGEHLNMILPAWTLELALRHSVCLWKNLELMKVEAKVASYIQKQKIKSI